VVILNKIILNKRGTMPKKETRPVIALECTQCKRINYHTERNVRKSKELLRLKKYCKWCKKRGEHKEVKK